MNEKNNSCAMKVQIILFALIIILNLFCFFGGVCCFKDELMLNILESCKSTERILTYSGCAIVLICITAIIIASIVAIVKLAKIRDHVCNSYEKAITEYLNKSAEDDSSISTDSSKRTIYIEGTIKIIK